jgi:arsenite-transporting ATPase
VETATVTEFILYGGKGGVGKSTLAAATGLQLAREGKRTLVVSTDPAHSLADVFDSDVYGTPTRVTDRTELHALEIDPRERFRERYGETFRGVLNDAQSLGVDVGADDVGDVTERGLVPGADEVAVVDLFAEYDDNPNWEYVVFDTAPTGHTLRLLELPDVMRSTMGKLVQLRSRMSGMASMVKGMLGNDDDGGPHVASEDLARIERVMEQVGDRLRDPERTEFRVVTLPERMALAETERLLDTLSEASIPTSFVVANKVLEGVDPSCDVAFAWQQQQHEQLASVPDRLGVDVVRMPLLPQVDGVDRLSAVADRLPAPDGESA